LKRVAELGLWALLLPPLAGLAVGGLARYAYASFHDADPSDEPTLLVVLRLVIYCAVAMALCVRAARVPLPHWPRAGLVLLALGFGLIRPLIVEITLISYLGYPWCGDSFPSLAHVMETAINPLAPLLTFTRGYC